MTKPTYGFTLIEMLITVAIVGILAALAGPSFSTMIKNNRLATSINDVLADLTLARSEASKRGVRVTVCVSSNGTSCTTGSNWTSGRIVFVDSKGSAGSVDTGDEILRVSPAFTNSVTLNSASFTNANYVQFRPNGMANSSGTLKICDNRAGSYGRTISISNTGRASLQSASVTCP